MKPRKRRRKSLCASGTKPPSTTRRVVPLAIGSCPSHGIISWINCAAAANGSVLSSPKKSTCFSQKRPTPASTLSNRSGTNERGDALQQALQRIPAEQRRVIVLAYFGGMSQSEISMHINVPLGTVKKRIRLGLQKMRAALCRKPCSISIGRASNATMRLPMWRSEMNCSEINPNLEAYALGALDPYTRAV